MDSSLQTPADWVPLPTETEIYLLPDGRVVIADLPIELGPLVEALGTAEACEIGEHAGAGCESTAQKIAPDDDPIRRENL